MCLFNWCVFWGMGVFVFAFVNLGWFDLSVLVFVYVVVWLCCCCVFFVWSMLMCLFLRLYWWVCFECACVSL